MESGPQGPNRPRDGEPEEGPGGGPQAPPPGALGGPAPAPHPEAPPGGPQAPLRGGDGPQAPPRGYGGSSQAPGYGGPVPPGGWQAPLTQPGGGWQGLPLASWGSRVGAALLDGLILLVPVLILVAIVVSIVAAGSDVGAAVVAVIVLLAYAVAAIFYAPVLMARAGPRNGQTWGKQIVGITVVRNDGQTMSMGFAFLREVVVKNLLFGWGGSLLLYVPTLLDYLWPLWDDENRCLHDMIVSTHVVRR